MSNLFVVGFDDTEASRRAVDFAAAIAKSAKAKLHLVLVLEWSPYSFHTPEELAERHKRREEELERANAVIKPVADKLNAGGVETSFEVRHGHAAELLNSIAEEQGAAQIVIGRTGSSSLAARLLGGMAVTLAQTTSVPLTIVP